MGHFPILIFFFPFSGRIYTMKRTKQMTESSIDLRIIYGKHMTSSSRLNKELWTNITRLKLLTKPDAPVKFLLEQSPFDGEEEEKVAAAKDEYVVIGRILPESDIYKESAFRIEMKLTSKYPQEPPQVRFLTPVYHPNVETNGKMSNKFIDQITE
jgi:ubiquitin-protein ligase